jgi:hypothetical protein
MRVVCVQREERFSPNSVDKDLNILSTLVEQLRTKGAEVSMVDAAHLINNKMPAEVIFSMARGEETLDYLQVQEAKGVKVLNPVAGIRNANRYLMTDLFMQHDIPMPLTSMVDTPEGFELLCEQWQVRKDAACWLKRADACAQASNDVVYCEDVEALQREGRDMFRRGITKVVVSEHLKGDIVKFYGVEGTDFFHWCRPDIRAGKYGLERINGVPKGYDVDEMTFKETCHRAAHVLSCPIYGGDAIVSQQGDFRIIDFNDWPSFSICSEDAAAAMVRLLARQSQPSRRKETV